MWRDAGCPALTRREVARLLGLTPDMVKHSERAGLAKLRAALEGAGVTAAQVREAFAHSAHEAGVMPRLLREAFGFREVQGGEVG